MPYKPISETSQLPHEGFLPEDLRFDMKMELKEMLDGKSAEQRTEELACDIAAFANTAGGVLLIGAHEHPKDSGKLHAYKPMTQSDAMSVCNVAKRALELCSPKPIIDPKVIASHEGNGFVVAINCDPYAAPPIGVAKHGHDGGPKWWAFPARRGRDNRLLRPEELATIMEPRLRRILLSLERIPPGDEGSRPIVVRFERVGGDDYMHATLQSIDHVAMSMVVLLAANRQSLAIPLDAVRMIWKDLITNDVQVAVLGGFEIAERHDYKWRFRL